MDAMRTKGDTANSTVAERIGTVRNPLTIIAIFAGIAEISSTVVLPLLNLQVQQTFVWFVIAFPLSLVILFFTVLFFKHHALYAPSDYKDEDNFRYTVRITQATPSEISEKDDQENILTAQINNPSSENLTTVETQNSSTHITSAGDRRTLEHRIIEYISKEEGIDIDIESKSTFSNGKKIVFDGSSIISGHLVVYELINYDQRYMKTRIENLVNKLIAYSGNQIDSNMSLNIIVYGEDLKIEQKRLASWRNLTSHANFKIVFRQFDTLILD